MCNFFHIWCISDQMSKINMAQTRSLNRNCQLKDQSQAYWSMAGEEDCQIFAEGRKKRLKFHTFFSWTWIPEHICAREGKKVACTCMHRSKILQKIKGVFINEGMTSVPDSNLSRLVFGNQDKACRVKPAETVLGGCNEWFTPCVSDTLTYILPTPSRSALRHFNCPTGLCFRSLSDSAFGNTPANGFSPAFSPLLMSGET